MKKILLLLPCLCLAATQAAGLNIHARGALERRGVSPYYAVSPYGNIFEYPHTAVYDIGCESCHYVYNPTLPPEWAGFVPSGDETLFNDLCWHCHNDVLAPYVRTHSSLTTDDGYGNWSFECRVCHEPHAQTQKWAYGSGSYLFQGTVTSRTDNTLRCGGAAWANNQFRGFGVFPDVGSWPDHSYKILSNDADTLDVEGPMDLAKAPVGATFVITDGKLVRDTVSTPSNGYREVRFFRESGANSFADGDAVIDGICQVCHTQTSYHKGNGSGVGAHNAATRCTTCHSHVNGFRGGGNSGSHLVHASLMTCEGGTTGCHGSSPPPMMEDGQNLQNTTRCNGCHSPGGSYNGVSDPAIGCKTNWTSGASLVYDGENLAPGKEKWCASCHDESPSVINGVTAPNVVGSESGSYPYGTGWGFYKTGHGLPAGQFYPSSGGITYGAGLACTSCHDPSAAHFDGLARTFDDGDSSTTNPALYRQGYRLKLVGGLEPMLVPWPGNTTNSSNNYRLCAGCHASGPFTDNNNLNTNLVSHGINRHEYHLDLFNQLRYASDWSGAANSRITCVNCHNVHGSTRLAMVRDGKLVGREPGIRIWYYNPAIVTYSGTSPNPPIPESLPLSASTGIVWSANSSSNLCTHCHGSNNITQEDRAPYQNVALPPTLDWTGEAGFAADGVTPDSGPGGTSFEFRVKYTDGNNDPPSSIAVLIDRNDDGDFLDAGETVPLVEVDATDVNRTDGKIYRVATVLNKPPDGSLLYRFAASDATGSAVQFGPVTPHTVSVTNSAPTLAWTGQSGYISDGVNPNGGPTGSTFEFRVLYADLDNEAPSFIHLLIDRNDDGDYLDPGEIVPMTAYDGDPTVSDGKIYTVSVVLTLAGDGALSYRFEASDGFDNATGSPVSPPQSVSVTSGSNTAPVLSWTGTPGYASDGVEPDLGAGGRPFTFQVTYTDADGDLPGTIEAWVDRSDDGDFLDAGEKIALVETDSGDTDVTDGKTYANTVVLEHPGSANKVEPLAYLFFAQDSQGAEATGAPVSGGSVNVQDAIKVPGEVSTITAAIASAVAGDIVLVSPGSYNEYVNFNGKDNIVLMAADESDGPNASILTNQVYAGNQFGGADNVTIYGFKVTSTVQPAFNFNLSQITVDHCLFDGNTGNSVYVNGADKVTVRNTTFRNNLDEAIYLTISAGFVDVDNCTFSGNTGNNGGGAVYSNTGGTWNISNSTFLNNTSTSATLGGGAVYLISGNATISNCLFEGNTTGSTGGGGAIYVSGGSGVLTIVDSVIRGNSCGTKGGGGIYIENTNRADLTNVIITGNRTTGSAGAVYEAGYANYLFCTISGNYASNLGGAIYHVNNLTTTVRNSVVYNNDAVNGGIHKQIYAISPRWTYIDVYNTLINQTPGNAGAPTSYEDMGGNITGSDPLFVNGLSPAAAPTTGGDYHLQSGSPCIGAADSGSPFGHDIDGQSRPGDGSYDMGADEYYAGGPGPGSPIRSRGAIGATVPPKKTSTPQEWWGIGYSTDPSGSDIVLPSP